MIAMIENRVMSRAGGGWSAGLLTRVAPAGIVALPTLNLETFTIPESTQIPGRPLRLARSLVVSVEVTRDGFVIRSGELDEDAFGGSFRSAYIDFLTSVRDRYDSLSRREARLSEEDSRTLAALRSVLQPA